MKVPRKAAVAVAALAATAFAVSCTDNEASVEVGAGDDAAESSAEQRIPGAAPTALFLPAELPPGFVVKTIEEPPKPAFVGAGGSSVTVYGSENSRPGDPTLVAIIDHTASVLHWGRGKVESDLRGDPAETRSADGAEMIQWLPGNEKIAAVIGVGLRRDEVRDAAQNAKVGQGIAIERNSRPGAFVELAAGDVWSASGMSGSTLLGGYLVRYANPDTGAVVEVSAASGGERLRRLADTALAPHRTLRLGSRQVTRGEMVLTPSPDDLGAVWSENGHVIVVASRGLSSDDLEAVVASVEEVSSERWAELRRQVAQLPPVVPDGVVVLFEGVTENGTRWVWYLDGDRTNFVSRGVSGDGPGHEGPVLAEDPSPLRDIGVYLAGAFIGGVTDTATARVVIELRNGEAIEARIIDHPTDPAIRFFGAEAPQEQTAAVVAYAADGSERERAPR